MARPREHGEATRRALLDAAEAIVERDGPDALSVRAVADAVGTTTRAVYSLFGSKSALLAALAQRSFELLAAGIEAVPETEDPAADLVEASVLVFRPMAIEHPSLFRLALLRVVPDLELTDGTRSAAATAFGLLCDRFERLQSAGRLPGRDPPGAAAVFNALCEGMATSELRRRAPGSPELETLWRDAFTALLAGLAISPSRAGVEAGRRRKAAGRGSKRAR